MSAPIINVTQQPIKVTLLGTGQTVTVTQNPVKITLQSGVQGPAGRTILNGSGAPSGALGSDGDFYIDTLNTRLYGPKSGGAWGSGVGLIGSGSGVGSYVYAQNTPAATWTIDHNLSLYPAVVVVASSGDVVEGDISYTSANQVVLSFAAAFSGTAYLN